MVEQPALREAIQAHFGAASYCEGTLNRPYLAQRVFADPEQRALLNSLVHEMARDEARHGLALKGMLERYFK